MLWMNGVQASTEFNVILLEYLEVKNAGRCFSGCKAVSAKQSPVSLFVLLVFPVPQPANDISCCAVIQDSTSLLVYNLPVAKLFLTAHLPRSQNL